MKLIKVSVMAITVLLLHSCGGGSGGGDATSSTSSPTSSFTKLYGSTGTTTRGKSVSFNGFYHLAGTGAGLDGANAGDSFIALSNVSGNFNWIKQINSTTGTTSINSFTAQGSGGNEIIIGGVTGNLDGNTITGTVDMFISSYDYNKTLLWTKLLGVAGAATTGMGVACYGNIYCYVVGTTYGNLSGVTKSGSHDAFITKYDITTTPATLVWTKLLGVAGAATDGVGVAVADDGNFGNVVYITGSTNGNLDGQTKTGLMDIFVTKFDTLGNKSWTKLYGSAGVNSSGVSMAATVNTAYIVGWTFGAIGASTQISSQDGFMASLNLTNGNLLWSKQVGGSQPSSTTYFSDIVLDENGKIYVSGTTTGSLSTNSVTGTTDGFIGSYTSSGLNLWLKQIGVTSKDTSFTSIDYEGYNYLYVGGYTYGNLDGKTLTGISDGLIMKYGIDGTKY